MARFNIADADNYGTVNTGSFFTLKDDKDTARVRFLYETANDIDGYSVHRVAVGDRERYVNCLRSYKDPIDNCPFCSAQLKVTPRLFIKLYNETSGECQIWERGKTYLSKLGSLGARYNPLCNEIVEVERNGKKGDMKTDYTFYPIENSEINLDDYECPSPLGTIILDKTFDEMNEYLETGSFPSDSASVAQSRSQSNDDELPWDNRPTGRRTPSQPQSCRRAF